MLDVIYQAENYCTTVDDELVDRDYSESDEESSEDGLCTFKTAKIRMLCANKIWREWVYERHWRPRVGVILISTMEEGAEKVLLVSHIHKNVFNYGYPKGKPNRGETIRAGGFRECKEEIGVDDLNYYLQINEHDGVIIKKYPHIGPLDRHRSRPQYYIMITTPSQFKGFQPDKKEILDVEWHSIYRIPCCDHCQIQQKYELLKDAKITYHMVTLRDINNENPAILEILAYVDEQNGNRNAYNKYHHAHRNCGHDLA